MAGNWTSAQVRPGVYINFINDAVQAVTTGSRGTVAMPLSLSFGPEHTFASITSDSDATAKFGISVSDPKMLYVREALKNASEVLVYRLNTGVKATATFGTTNVCTVTANYSGSLGNSITITVAANAANPAKMDVTTLVSSVSKDVQTVTNIQDLKANFYVTFAGTGAIEATAGTSLSAGTDGNAANSDYTAFLSGLDTQFFNVIAFPSTDASLQASLLSTVKTLRDTEGKKVQAVAPNFAADYEGVINVGNGYVLSDGTQLSATDAVAWVAGATAGAAVNQSLTYQVVQGAVDANPRMSNSATIAALQAGQFVFTYNGSTVVVEQDINSSQNLDSTQFGKNRVLRVLDAINNDLNANFASQDIGKVNNDADGQAIIKTAIALYMQGLQTSQAITNFDASKDITIDPVKSVGDSMYINIAVQPVDSAEKFYINVNVN